MMNDMENVSNQMSSTMQTVDTAHEDMIHDAQMDYCGVYLATCSSDKTIKIFEVANNSYKQVQTLTGHNSAVWQLAWAHPSYGNVLASCSYDRSVIIWTKKQDTWENTYTYKEHDSSVNSVCWAPYQYGLMLACGSSDGAISVIMKTDDEHWNAKKINNAHTIGCNAVSWEPVSASVSLSDILNLDGALRDSQVKRFASGGCDNLVKIWKVAEDEEWTEEHKLEGHSDWVRDVAWAPSIGVNENVIASCSQDRRVIIWTADLVDAGEATEGEKREKWTAKILNVFDDVVWHVSWSITGNHLAVSGGDNRVSIWKESLSGHWACVNEINRGGGPSTSKSDTETKTESKSENRTRPTSSKYEQKLEPQSTARFDSGHNVHTSHPPERPPLDKTAISSEVENDSFIPPSSNIET